jgi:hypothetical protein
LKSKACFPIEANLRSEGKFRIEGLPGGRAAPIEHEGKVEEYAEISGYFLVSLLKQGYRFLGAARDIFETRSVDLRPGMGIRKLQLVASSK